MTVPVLYGDMEKIIFFHFHTRGALDQDSRVCWGIICNVKSSIKVSFRYACKPKKVHQAERKICEPYLNMKICKLPNPRPS